MAIPASRSEFKEYCLRALGKPVIEINVDDDQVEDRIDQAIKYYWDYHFDGTEKIYYKHQVVGNERDGAVKSVNVISGGTLYSNSDTLSITSARGGTGATFTIKTYANGTIQTVTPTVYGARYSNTDTVTVTTSTGSGANLAIITGDGSITLPENIIGVVRLFSIADPSIRSDDLFNIRYQIALNDLYTLTSISMIPYYMTMTNLGIIAEMLVGQQPIRYNRHRDKVYLDMDWGSVAAGEYLLIEAYQIVDPDEYTDMWGDRWLATYATQLIKRQWGNNLKKFNNMQLPGGVTFNGQQIYNEAQEDIEKLEREMINSYSLPVSDMIG